MTMRKIGAFGLFWTLACGGAVAPDTALTPPPEPPPVEPPLPVGGAVQILAWESIAEKCQATLVELAPSVPPVLKPLATLDGACGNTPRATKVEGKTLLVGAKSAVWVDGDVATPIPAPPFTEALEALVVEKSGTVVATAEVQAESTVKEEDEKRIRSWQFQGQSYSYTEEGYEADVILCQTWELADAGWKLREAAPLPLAEGMSSPFCGEELWTQDDVLTSLDIASSWGYGNFMTRVEPEVGGRLPDVDWHWLIPPFAGTASEPLEGQSFLGPVAFTETQPWTLIEGMEAGRGVSLIIQERWAIVCSNDHSVVLDMDHPAVPAWKGTDCPTFWVQPPK